MLSRKATQYLGGLTFDSPLVLTGHEAAVYALCAFGSGSFLSGGGDGQLVRWAPDKSQHGKAIATLDDSIFGILPIYQRATIGSLSAKQPPPTPPAAIAVATLSGDFYWVTTAGSASPKRWRLHQDGVFGLVQLEDYVYACGGKGRLSRWAAGDGSFDRFAALDTVRLRGLAYLRDPGLLAVGTANGDVHLVDPESMRIVHTHQIAHERTVFSIVDAGNQFYTAGRDGAIRSWNTNAPFAQNGNVAAHAATVNQLSLWPSVSGHQLLSAGRDREIRVWNTISERLVLAKALNAPRDMGHVASVNAVLAMDSRRFVSASDDRTIRVWNRIDRASEDHSTHSRRVI